MFSYGVLAVISAKCDPSPYTDGTVAYLRLDHSKAADAPKKIDAELIRKPTQTSLKIWFCAAFIVSLRTSAKCLSVPLRLVSVHTAEDNRGKRRVTQRNSN